jgi:hypothetical protein
LETQKKAVLSANIRFVCSNANECTGIHIETLIFQADLIKMDSEDIFGGVEEDTTNQDDFFGTGDGDEVVAEATFVDDDEAEEESFAAAEEETPFESFPPAVEEEKTAAPVAIEPAEDECSKLTEWNAEWRQKLEEKAKVSRSAKDARKESASNELKAMEAMRLKTREAKFAKNRSDQLKFLEEVESVNDIKNPWAAVISLVNVLPSKDEEEGKDRMKALLIQMKGTDSGPGIPA